MGCDVHMYAEVRKNKQWEKLGNVFKNPYYNPDKDSQTDSDGYEWNAKMTDQPCRGRNYDLFAILADVRNGRGFAGIKTGEGFNPIDDPRGLPVDVSAEIQQQSNDWDGDGHSHSYFTVKELLDYDWGQLTMKRGVVSLSQYIVCKDNNTTPNSYSGAVSGSNIVTVDEDVADEIIKGNTPPEVRGAEVYVNMHWGITYKDSCPSFLETTIPELLTHGDSEDVRIVFFFDN